MQKIQLLNEIGKYVSFDCGKNENYKIKSALFENGKNENYKI